MQNKFLETWWASLGLRPVGGPRERMGSTFFGLVDMGLLGSPTGLLGLPSLISHFILFTYNVFSGSIPTSTQLQSFDSDRFIGNLGLCGPPLTEKCLEDVTSNTNRSENYQEDGDEF